MVSIPPLEANRAKSMANLRFQKNLRNVIKQIVYKSALLLYWVLRKVKSTFTKIFAFGKKQVRQCTSMPFEI